MLSYEDSLALKELGYPQELKQGDWYYGVCRRTGRTTLYLNDWPVRVKTDVWNALGELLDYVRVPTTDGMIEGLGDHLEVIRRNKETGQFFVIGVWGQDGSEKPYRTFWLERGQFGLLPLEEGLCELWKNVKSSKKEAEE
jgi:hypothetical protein